ncbi:MAG TPA: protein kinase [Gemmatimonadaceae bacterium]|nr:protein kinase [Gemmatimonadaceae bacterium]
MQAPRPGLGLSTRIFLSSAGIVIVVMAITLFVAQRSAMQAAEASIRRQLDATVSNVMEKVNGERDLLTGRLQAYAENATYRASIDRSEPEFLEYTIGAAEQSGAQWAQFVSREGILEARSDAPGMSGDTLVGSPLIRKALDATTAQGFGVAGDSGLMHTIAVPVEGAGGRLLGVLMAVKFVTDSIARAVGAQTRSEVVFFALSRDGGPRVVAATDGLRTGGTRLATLTQLIRADSSVQQAGAPEDADRLVVADRLTIGSEHFVSRQSWLTSVAGRPVGGFLALRSLEDELAATGYVDFREQMLLAGVGGLALALLIAALTSRQIVRPVTVLADASRRAAEGDYKAVIPEGGSDEIGTLSSAFRRLLADLKDKQALVEFLSTPGAAATRALSVPPQSAHAVPANMTALEPGQTLGSRYEIRSVLGVGGMGVVYKANDRELGEIVAIKTLKPNMLTAESNALDRFKSEIRLARRIAHRNVVRTYDLGEVGGLYYLTMEYVEGKSLKELIRERRRLPVSVVLPIAKQLCRALEVAHDEGVIHRDIKPQNMVVQPDGVLKVMDFGIARLASRPADGGLTQQGMIIGTPEYMAPEQLLADDVDVRADLYAVGVVLYECLHGGVPFTADTPMALVAKVLEEEPAALATEHADVPKAISDVVMWSMAKSRDKRPRSAAELHERLDQIALA